MQGGGTAATATGLTAGIFNVIVTDSICVLQLRPQQSATVTLSASITRRLNVPAMAGIMVMLHHLLQRTVLILIYEGGGTTAFKSI